jgi:hypothetical protein
MTHHKIYRNIQRLNQARLEALLQDLRVQRAGRIEALRGFEEKYVVRLNREGFSPIAVDIEGERGLAADDRRLLLRELAAFDVLRRRRLAKERRQEAPVATGILSVSPESARAMLDEELRLTNRRLKALHDGLRSVRLGTYSESYAADPDTDALETPAAYYVSGNGASKFDDEISGLAVKSLMPHEVVYLRSRIFVARELRRRDLAWRFS